VKWQAAVSDNEVKWKVPAEHVGKGNGTATNKKKEAVDESEKLTF
jgi:hypothetical protein